MGVGPFNVVKMARGMRAGAGSMAVSLDAGSVEVQWGWAAGSGSRDKIGAVVV